MSVIKIIQRGIYAEDNYSMHEQDRPYSWSLPSILRNRINPIVDASYDSLDEP